MLKQTFWYFQYAKSDGFSNNKFHLYNSELQSLNIRIWSLD